MSPSTTPPVAPGTDEAAPVVRPARLADLPGLYRVCLLTGFTAAEVADGRNPELLGHIYVGPYVVAGAEWCRSVIDPDGVGGYLIATPDTAAFQSWARAEWWPALREQYPLAAVRHAHPGDRGLIEALHHPPESPEELLADYPAHLHIDLLERVRGTGLGGLLIRDLIARLAAAGVAGVHLGVGDDNTHAIGFYRHLGFTDAARTPGTLWMARPI